MDNKEMNESNEQVTPNVASTTPVENPETQMSANPLKEDEVESTSKEEPIEAVAQEGEEYVTEELDENDNEESEDLEDEAAHEDFSNFDKPQVLERTQALLSQVKNGGQINFKSIDSTLNDLRNQIDALNQEDKEAAKKKFDEQVAQETTNSEDEKPTFEFRQDENVEKFYAAFKEIKEAKKNYFEQLEQSKQANLKAKQDILEEVKALSDPLLSEDPEQRKSRKQEFEKIKELQAKWREIGPVPAADADNLYKSYKAVLDIFYNQKTMEKELLELDRKKNLEAKVEICERAEKLLEYENVNEAVKELNALHKEYKGTGPVPRSEQEELWQRFKATSDKIYDRRRVVAEEYKTMLEDNMKIKQALCLRIEPFADFKSDSIKEWNSNTKDVLAIQKEWEDAGPVPREVAPGLNKQFWQNFKLFFQHKSEFFAELDKVRNENLAKKEALCEKAEALKDSDEWEKAANELKDLQREWKDIGSVPGKHRESIYARFKAACDHFFEQKRKQNKNRDNDYGDNFKKKKEICDQIKELAESGAKDLSKLEDFYAEFQKIGFVPRNKINETQELFAEAINKFLDNTDLNNKEKIDWRTRMQVKVVKENPRAASRFKQKEGSIQRRMSGLENDIKLWTTNIEFFANSKRADALRNEFKEKIEKAEQELEVLRQQLNVIDDIEQN
ncbi:MAG: DUF349 domain-containing protein [Bernardetiaceae bacterium]|nr:DUF349 domain-containing protein [Bernardetiaceae bacterium]